jgi:hypothetical protein
MVERARGAARAPRRSLPPIVLVAGIAFAIGCGGEKEPDMPAVKPPVNQEGLRDFNTAELDTLRALKKRLGVTRDEYWDDRGGVLANDACEVWYPPGKMTVSHGMYVLDYMMKCRRTIDDMFGRLPEGKLTVVCAQTMEAYTEATGRQWWHYARLDDDRITYQPVPILVGRGLVDIAVPRECYEWHLMRLTRERAPLWLIEGFASTLSNEWTILEDNLTEFPGEAVHMTIGEVESALDADDDRKRARIAYYNAMRMVDRLIGERGQDKVVAMIRAIAEGARPEAAAVSVYGTSYDELVADAGRWESGNAGE